MLAKQCMLDVVDRMSMKDLKDLKKQIKKSILQKANQWMKEIKEEAIKRNLNNIEVYLPQQYTGLRFWIYNCYIDISIVSGLVEGTMFGVARYMGYDNEIVRSDIHVDNILEYYINTQQKQYKIIDQLAVDRLKYIIYVWNSYKETFGLD